MSSDDAAQRVERRFAGDWRMRRGMASRLRRFWIFKVDCVFGQRVGSALRCLNLKRHTHFVSFDSVQTQLLEKALQRFKYSTRGGSVKSSWWRPIRALW